MRPQSKFSAEHNWRLARANHATNTRAGRPCHYLEHAGSVCGTGILPVFGVADRLEACPTLSHSTAPAAQRCASSLTKRPPITRDTIRRLAPETWDMRRSVLVEKRPWPRETRKLSSV